MSKLIINDITSEDAEILVNGKPFHLAYSENLLLDSDDEPMYDDAEDFVMHSITIDEDLVEEVIPQIAEAILPHIKQYLPN
jgi:hypothetical protein